MRSQARVTSSSLLTSFPSQHTRKLRTINGINLEGTTLFLTFTEGLNSTRPACRFPEFLSSSLLQSRGFRQLNWPFWNVVMSIKEALKRRKRNNPRDSYSPAKHHTLKYKEKMQFHQQHWTFQHPHDNICTKTNLFCLGIGAFFSNVSFLATIIASLSSTSWLVWEDEKGVVTTRTVWSIEPTLLPAGFVQSEEICPSFPADWGELNEKSSLKTWHVNHLFTTD